MTDPLTPDPWAQLRLAHFASSGPVRDRLIEAIMNRRKTSTTSLLRDYEREGEPLPHVGERAVVIDSRDQRVAIIEVTDVRIVPLGDVDLTHVVDEGDMHATVTQWRAVHEAFWSPRPHDDDADALVEEFDDATPVVLERFTLVTDLT